jgi:hypothetical protein
MAVDINITGSYKVNGVPIGGGGLQGPHALVKLTPSISINASVNGAGIPSIPTLANRLASVPFIPNQTFTSENLYINATSAVAGALAKILIYSDLDGVPSSLLFESANLDCSTTGIKTAVTSFTFHAGTTYWLTVFTSGVSNVSGLPITALLTIRVTLNSPAVGLAANNTYGPAPTTYPASLINLTTTVPCVFITAS